MDPASAFVLSLRTMIYIFGIAVLAIWWPASWLAFREFFRPGDTEAEHQELLLRISELGKAEGRARKMTVAALLASAPVWVSALVIANTEALIAGWGFGRPASMSSLPVRITFHLLILIALSLKLLPTLQYRFGRYGYAGLVAVTVLGVVLMTMVILNQ